MVVVLGIFAIVEEDNGVKVVTLLSSQTIDVINNKMVKIDIFPMMMMMMLIQRLCCIS